MTAAELLRLPGDGFRFRSELVRGELRRFPLHGAEHGQVTCRIAMALGRHVETLKLGVAFAPGTGFQIAKNPDTVLAPDASFVCSKRIRKKLDENYFQGAPDLAVEVVSPGDTMNEVDEKVEEWLEAGTLEVWVINPRRKNITVYAANKRAEILSGDDELSGGEVVPDFRLRVGRIFE